MRPPCIALKIAFLGGIAGAIRCSVCDCQLIAYLLLVQIVEELRRHLSNLVIQRRVEMIHVMQFASSREQSSRYVDIRVRLFMHDSVDFVVVHTGPRVDRPTNGTRIVSV
jgi:hypothetical protein